MIVYSGNFNRVKKQALKNYTDKNNLVYIGDGLSIIDDNPKESIMIQNSKQLLIFAKGNLLNFTKESFSSEYECITGKSIDSYSGFFKKLEGYFCLIIWDKIKKKLFIINDKLGLNPLYYTVTSQNELIVSTKIEDFVHIFEIPINIDLIALKQFATFNYFIGERTFIKNIYRLKPGTALIWEDRSMTKENYWNISQFFSCECIQTHDFLKQFTQIFCEVVSNWTYGNKRVGLLLSGGYDSRAILACLYNLGVKGYAYTWDNPAVEETHIAQRLAEATGFKLRYLPFYPEEKDIEKLIYEVGELTDFSFPLFHIGRYNAIKQISDSVDMIFSGQGELIRVTPVPNDYISQITLSYIYKTRPPYRAEHFFQNEDMSSDLFQDFEYRHLSPTEQLTCFLLYNAYRDDYGILRYGESEIIPVAMPFFDVRVIELLLKSPYSIARLKSWKRNAPFTLKTRKIYYNIVKQFAPHLLDIPLDRGYPQRFDNCYLNSILTGIWSLKNAINHKLKKKETPPWWKFIYDLLLENKTLNRDIYCKEKILESLNRFPYWSQEESYELEKIARFELFYRYFIEPNQEKWARTQRFV